MKIPAHFFVFCLLLLGLLSAYSAIGAEHTTPQTRDAEKAYSGNPNSMIYHNSGCRYFTCKACVLRFSTPEEARQKGYRACKKCGG